MLFLDSSVIIYSENSSPSARARSETATYIFTPQNTLRYMLAYHLVPLHVEPY